MGEGAPDIPARLGAMPWVWVKRTLRIRALREGFPARESIPSLILFDALDARVHGEADKIRDLLYFEYALLRFDGKAECKGARKLQVDVKKREDAQPAGGEGRVRYDIEAVRRKDHALIRVMGPEETVEFIVALPDNSRFAHISLTGDHCLISGIHIEQDENPIGEGYIPRIAEEVSYIKGCPEGDVPNVVFPCAALADAETGRIAIYYGGADTVVALAFTTVDETVAYIKAHDLIK